MNWMVGKSPSIAISWNGLPQYAARLIKAAIEAIGTPVTVIGSQPEVPIKGMEEAIGQKIHWIKNSEPTSWSALGLKTPDIFIQSGWSYPAFNALGRQVKTAGGSIIGLSDANWRGDLRQLLFGPLGFRLLHRRHFDYMMVPGRQGEKLMRYFGMPKDRVSLGMYGADPTLFNSGKALKDREKSFLFVGRFVERKNPVGLAKAFAEFAKTHKDWTLHMCGSGPLKAKIPQHTQIIIEDFVQPKELVSRFHKSRFFVLASKIEAWGLVVHEAALCGCAMVLSSAIGSASDLANENNSVSFNTHKHDDIVRALTQAASFDQGWLEQAHTTSRELSTLFGPKRFASELNSLVKRAQFDRACDENKVGN